jgi:hypothetical protein
MNLVCNNAVAIALETPSASAQHRLQVPVPATLHRRREICKTIHYRLAVLPFGNAIWQVVSCTCNGIVTVPVTGVARQNPLLPLL